MTVNDRYDSKGKDYDTMASIGQRSERKATYMKRYKKEENTIVI
jgi:hypothetical protein